MVHKVEKLGYQAIAKSEETKDTADYRQREIARQKLKIKKNSWLW
jgi:hypothetical protein